MASLSTTIEYGGITWSITATAVDGGLSFNITPSTETAGDIRGFFFDLETIDTGSSLQSDTDASDGFVWSEGTITGDDITETQWGEDLVIDLGNGANINGEEPSNSPIEGYEGPDIFDLGIEFGKSGAGKGDFINSTSFTVEGMTLADLEDQYFGLRLTSTAPDGEGSLKLVGQFPSLDGDDPLYQGFTRGSWLHGSRSDDLTGLATKTYEELFLDRNTALTFTSAGKGNPTLDNPTLVEVLGLNGGGLNQFAAQSTAAYLNALYLEGDSDPLTAYSLSSEQVMNMTKAVLNEGSLKGTVDLSGYSWYQDTNGVKGFQQAGIDSQTGVSFGDTVVSGSTGMGMQELTSLFDFYNNFGTDPAEFMLNPSLQPLVV